MLVAAAFGAGSVLMLAVLTAGWYRYESRPARPWDRTAISAQFDCVDVEGEGHTLVFSYTVYNHTDRDYRINGPSNITLAGRRGEQRDLVFSVSGSESILRVDYPVLVPPNERSRVTIHLGYPCPGLRLEPDTSPQNRDTNRSRVSECVEKETGNLAGFVLFDDRERIQVDFPNP